jgi:predicted ATP-grasp superfamily ATP-dependent carboligase
MYGLKIDVKELQKESKSFEDKLWKVVETAQAIKEVGEVPGKSYIG